MKLLYATVKLGRVHYYFALSTPISNVCIYCRYNILLEDATFNICDTKN